MTIRSALCSDVRSWSVAIAIAVIAARPGAVVADAKAEAQVLFDQGISLFSQGNYAQACSALEASVDKFPGLGSRGKLAECYERLGKLAKAWALYREVAAAARREGDRRREQVATARADALLPRVPKITIAIPPASRRADLTVTRDGRTISPAEYGLPIYVDAGKYAITASAPGMAPFAADVLAIDGRAVTVEVPVLTAMLATPISTGDAPSRPNGAPIEPGTPRAREVAAALIAESAALIARKDYQPALDRLATAYELAPTPALLSDMAAALREMGRLADAADLYQAFIAAPATSPEQRQAARRVVDGLDAAVHVLTVGVTPRGADISIDGGPWIAVGDRRLRTRLAPGLHMIRSRKPGFDVTELSVHAFKGQRTEVELVLRPARPEAGRPAAAMAPAIAAPTSQDGQTVIPVLAKGPRAERGGVQYVSTAIVRGDDAEIVEVVPAPVGVDRELGVTAQLRIDGGGGGAALAFGVSFSPRALRNLELELTAMVSRPTPPDPAMTARRIYGVFAGARYRLLTGRIRPTLGGGIPMFLSDDKPRVGVRGSGGVELVITRHLAAAAEVGLEHFFNTQLGYDANVVVPVVQLTGRL